MKLKVFGPEIDPDGGGMCLTSLLFTFDAPARIEVEMPDGSIYNISYYRSPMKVDYIQVTGPEGGSLIVVPEGQRQVHLSSFSHLLA